MLDVKLEKWKVLRATEAYSGIEPKLWVHFPGEVAFQVKSEEWEGVSQAKMGRGDVEVGGTTEVHRSTEQQEN